MFFTNDKINKFKDELVSFDSRLKLLELEHSKLIEHMKSIRGSMNRYARGKDPESEEEEEDNKSKDIKSVKYY